MRTCGNDQVHPDLRSAARWLPRGGGRTMLRLAGVHRLLRRARVGAQAVREVCGLTIRIYLPAPLMEPAPAILWLHGGGYVGGYAAQDDKHCHRLAQVGAIVAAVDYRLAPRHPYPAGLEDAYVALRWLARHDAVDRS